MASTQLHQQITPTLLDRSLSYFPKEVHGMGQINPGVQVMPPVTIVAPLVPCVKSQNMLLYPQISTDFQTVGTKLFLISWPIKYLLY